MFLPGLNAVLALSLALHQSPEERDRLLSFRDSLSIVVDSAAIAHLEQDLIERAKSDRNNPVIHLRLGLVAYRLGQLAASPDHLDEAAAEFEWAAELSPDWPFPWYGLGITEFALRSNPLTGNVTVNRLRQVLNVDETSRSAAAQRRALGADPHFVPAIVAMVSTAIADNDPSELDFALLAARRAGTGSATTSSDYWIARGAIERNRGSLDSALLAYEHFARTGGDRGLSRLELARTSFFLGQAEAGVRLYYAVVDSTPSPAAWDLLLADLGWIASTGELTTLDTVSGDARSWWVRRFWSDRDFASGHRAHSRLTEHYRRLWYAEQHFRRRSSYWQVDRIYPYRGDQRGLDDRGIIYVRQGEPAETAFYVGPVGTIPNISWKYVRPTGNLILHFRPHGDVAGISNYRLVESLLDIGTTEEFIESRTGLDPTYNLLALPGSSDRLRYLERERGHQAIVTGTTTDSHVLAFERQLRSVVSGYGLSGEGAQGRILLTLAVPLSEMSSGRGFSPGSTQLLELGMSVRDREGSIRRLDTVIAIRTDHPNAERAYASPVVVLPLPPGEYQLNVVGRTASGRAGFGRTFPRIVIPDQQRFELSDIVLGTRESGLTWYSGRHAVALNPQNSYPADTDLLVYYEAGGLTPGTSYRTAVELLEDEGTGRPLVALAFTEIATSAVMMFERSIELQGVRSGTYTLRITLTGADGRQTTRESTFEVH